ncbi:hypothetical protein M0812_13885 [Anaeramoeba flamelloides]|uniref:Uncharacterized protein n=1 Tax=Anaeramoeba flamelloides TaxID=1746091 RepID=A0AAV7ZPG5_9EUKA|nr:hypothetical protein M0812_13885 [Anaeramoeba flamelloides]
MGNTFFQSCKKKRLKPNHFQNYTRKIHLSNDPICLLSSDGMLDLMNKRFLSLLKINNGSIINGKSVYTLFPQTQTFSKKSSSIELQKILQDFKNSKQFTKTFLWTFLNSEGQNINVRIWMSLIQDSGDYYIQLVLRYARKLTKRVKIKEQEKPKLKHKYQHYIKSRIPTTSKQSANNFYAQEETKTRKAKHTEEIQENNYSTQRTTVSELFPSRLHFLKGSPLYLPRFETQKMTKPRTVQTSIKDHKFSLFPLSLTNTSNNQTFTIENDQEEENEMKEIDMEEQKIFYEIKQGNNEKMSQQQQQQQLPFNSKKIDIQKIQPYKENEDKHRKLSEHIYEIKLLLNSLENDDIKFDILNTLNDISDLFDQSFSKIAWKIQLLLLQHKLSPHNHVGNNSKQNNIYQKDLQLNKMKHLEEKNHQEKMFEKKFFSNQEESNQILLL